MSSVEFLPKGLLSDPFIYADYRFGRLVFNYQEWGAVIMVTDGNKVVAGRFSKENMPDRVKYAFRPKRWTSPPKHLL